MMMPRERFEEILKAVNSVDLEVTMESVEVDRDYVIKLLGQCDQYAQKFEDYIIQVAFAVTQLENKLDDKKDLYEASHQELLTTDEVIKNMRTGKERDQAAKNKLKELTDEIKEHTAEFKDLSTLKNMLERRVKSISSTKTSVNKQYEAKINAMRHSYLGDTMTVEIPTSRGSDDKSTLAEDDNLAEMLTGGGSTESSDDKDEQEEGKLDLDL